jgi:hypothetical protein
VVDYELITTGHGLSDFKAVFQQKMANLKAVLSYEF